MRIRSGLLLSGTVLLVLVLAAVQHVSGQGLDVSFEQLGAGELASLGALDEFEDLLELSEQYTGKPRKRRMPSFSDAISLQQLQLQTYHVAGSPAVYNSFNKSQTPGGRSYLPKVRDQGSCSTCVGG
jgi:hypothetical protein